MEKENSSQITFDAIITYLNKYLKVTNFSVGEIKKLRKMLLILQTELEEREV